MKVFSTLLTLTSILGALAAPAPVVDDSHLDERALTITVSAPAGTIVGKRGLLTDDFNGIPYAAPPISNLRLRPPQRISSPLNNFDATKAAAACPQFLADSDDSGLLAQVMSTVSRTALFQRALKISEDCLSVNVIRPRGTKAGDNLPVLFWIYGGGFELGWSSMYDGGGLVQNAALNGKPYVFVAVNYRVGAWGFMPGKEILADGAGNLGLLDQRMGLEWVADNIAAFGGDPSRVTIWGESAGAISVWNQMTAYGGNIEYKGKPLFRGAIMNSGSIIPADPVDCPKGQAIYDAVVEKAGCSGPDSLACLRQLPLDQFTEAANSVPAILSYTSVALSYLPRPDGSFMPESPQQLLLKGRYAAVPMIIGDQEDEGTLFSLFQANTTETTPMIVRYLKDLFFNGASEATLTALVETYEDVPAEGSPFRTGPLNEVYKGFKRLAAILGDLVFTITRRIFLDIAKTVNPSVPAWSYIASYNYGTPILGTFHGSDLLQVFFGILPNKASRDIQAYYSNFVYNLDPNNYSGGTNRLSRVIDNWPQWERGTKKLIQFYAHHFQPMIDDFRTDSEQILSSNFESF
ncbi:alpha/beta-hydrolase, partial [Cutaneotrichosporon oleaginosum]